MLSQIDHHLPMINPLANLQILLQRTSEAHSKVVAVIMLITVCWLPIIWMAQGWHPQKQEPVNNNEEEGSSKEEFTPPSDHRAFWCRYQHVVCGRDLCVNGLISSESNTMVALISRWVDFYEIICLIRYFIVVISCRKLDLHLCFSCYKLKILFIRTSVVIHVKCHLKHTFIVILSAR
ncbi:hypothetical protein GQ457_HM000560 [Hibiscus cannabinus]